MLPLLPTPFPCTPPMFAPGVSEGPWEHRHPAGSGCWSWSWSWRRWRGWRGRRPSSARHLLGLRVLHGGVRWAFFCLFCSGSGCGDHLGLLFLGAPLLCAMLCSALRCTITVVHAAYLGSACVVAQSQPSQRGIAGCFPSRCKFVCGTFRFSPTTSSPSTRPLMAAAHWWRVLTPASPPNPLLWPAVACVWADGRWPDLGAGHRGACAVHGPLPPRSCSARQAGGAPSHRCRAQGAAAHGRVDVCVLLCVCACVAALEWGGCRGCQRGACTLGCPRSFESPRWRCMVFSPVSFHKLHKSTGYP